MTVLYQLSIDILIKPLYIITLSLTGRQRQEEV